MKKRKPYWEMNAAELAEATREFDDSHYHPPVVKPTAAESAQLRRWKQKRRGANARLTISREKELVEQTGIYASAHGVTLSEVVADALRRLMNKKSA